MAKEGKVSLEVEMERERKRKTRRTDESSIRWHSESIRFHPLTGVSNDVVFSDRVRFPHLSRERPIEDVAHPETSCENAKISDALDSKEGRRGKQTHNQVRSRFTISLSRARASSVSFPETADFR